MKNTDPETLLPCPGDELAAKFDGLPSSLIANGGLLLVREETFDAATELIRFEVKLAHF
jgi:hypothetical protein